MRPYNTVNYHASEGDGAERSQETGIQLCNQLTVAASGSDCTMLSCIPEYNVRLQAVDSSRQSVSTNEWAGIDCELNVNCNHNASYEPLPNEGCGCTGSYNGGAGAGTASCHGHDHGSDWRREQSSYHGGQQCCNPDYKYVAEFKNPQQPCPPHETPCYSPLPPKTHCHLYDANTYHRPRNNTSPQCMDKYLPINRPGSCDPCSSDCPDTYELVRNTDAQRYKGRGPDRSYYFADDCYQGCS